jgi:hypothetical protein
MNLFFFTLGILASLLSILIGNAIKSTSRIKDLESHHRDLEDVVRDSLRDLDIRASNLSDSFDRDLERLNIDFNAKLDSLHQELVLSNKNA